MRNIGDLLLNDLLHKRTGRYMHQDRFRVLIIGKTGVGKTTILEKFCGGKIVEKPSDKLKRGKHDITLPLLSEANDSFVAHDSRGFEAGQESELNKVDQFIKERSKMEPTRRIHAIWYCVQSDSSRPFQHAENEFFKKPRGSVPVIAVFTKFDMLVTSCKQECSRKAGLDSMSESLDDAKYQVAWEQVSRDAEEEASRRFEEFYKSPLLRSAYPPDAIIKLSNVHRTPEDDHSLDDLTAATWSCLRSSRMDVAMLFAVAQRTFVHTYYKQQQDLRSNYLNMSTLEKKRAAMFSLAGNDADVDDTSVERIAEAMKTYVDDRPCPAFDVGVDEALRDKLHVAQLIVDSSIVSECLLRWKKRNRRPLEPSFIDEIACAYRNSSSAQAVQADLIATKPSMPDEVWSINLCSSHTERLACFIDELRSIQINSPSSVPSRS
ncbi:hypothetical protein SISNIDRAFT_497637 [Sistotremastrum niveocremeum HHB9708]|uniref:G domain-containing protein n=2 Tax=Sistotremastraceae TaxID=3402574 RepID=A0A164PVF8_9AGAM|nr:hypothetical protein SISNIDRAFT_497637 [Sistotremastrum niveocremeum HHB9708]KZT34413.1 hypothetical protein SISSUDRAFT_1131852 [Sistotremastrum suecicum HHB10207 ss-3]